MYLACLHSTALTQKLLPFLRRQNHPLLRPIFRRAFTSIGSFTSLAYRHKLRIQPELAQARRSSSSVAEDELVASPSDLQYTGPLEVIKYPDPILRAKSKRVNLFDESLTKLVHDMFDVMYRTDGMGLSAPQVGINVQLMVFNLEGERGKGEEIVLVNPRINKYSRKIVPFYEACLSLPGIGADVERPASLKVEAQDITGAKFEFKLTELLARVFQHEYDHLQGVLYVDRLSDDVLDTVRAELQALEKEYEERTCLVSPEKIEARGRRSEAVGSGKS